MKRFFYYIKVRFQEQIRFFKARSGKRLCYKCHRYAVSVDHVPPKTIFIDSRVNLVTVPSCKKHNADKSEADEYLKNILTMHIQSGDKGTKAFKSTVFRSIKRRKRHYAPLLESSQFVMASGQVLGKLKYDYRQFHSAISKIADGIYFLEKQAPYSGNWFVYNLSGALDSNDQADILQHRQLLQMAQTIPWIEIPQFQNRNEFMAFKWQEVSEKAIVYRLTFYSNVHIIAFSNFEKKQKL